MNNVRNLGYVSGQLDVEKVDPSDRMTRGRQSIFDIKPATAKGGTAALVATCQPTRSCPHQFMCGCYGRPAQQMGRYTFVLWFLLSSIYLFPCLFSAVADWIPYLQSWCDPSANLRCMSETCCTRLTGNARRKNRPTIRHLHAHHRTKLSGHIFATKACIDNRKKTC